MKGKIIFLSLALILGLSSCTKAIKTTVIVSNPTDIDRTIETVEIGWNQLASKRYSPDSIIVLDSEGKEIPSQIIYASNGTAQSIIFQVKLAANASKDYTLACAKPANYPTMVYGKQAHDRYNDFIWENNLIAFRIYHSDLIPIDGPSGGVDVWSKRTHNMVIDKWLVDKDYHNDHGEGCDFYKVGPTLGAGSISLLENKEMKQHQNYTDVKVLANGPIRLVAEFSFNKQTINDKEVSITKRLTYDANCSMNRFDVTFNSELKELPLVTGIVKREGEDGVEYQDSIEGNIVYWQPKEAHHGHQGIAIVMNQPTSMGTLNNHLVAYSTAQSGKAFTYYSGACWDIAAYYKTAEDWKAYVETFYQQTKQPLEVKVVTE